VKLKPQIAKPSGRNALPSPNQLVPYKAVTKKKNKMKITYTGSKETHVKRERHMVIALSYQALTTKKNKIKFFYSN